MNTTALLGPRFMHVVLPHDPPELLRHPRRVLLAPEDLVEILKGRNFERGKPATTEPQEMCTHH